MGAKKTPVKRESHDIPPQTRWCRFLMFLATMDTNIACVLFVCTLAVIFGTIGLLFKAIMVKLSW
ncbi:hypothetical protein IMZ48_25355 [Candidatus Bathyarchaeota archaeon]|nr:hypothetical protein [Candidatus Bathyarchaeota archaeon]